MSMFHELMMRKKEEIMYATIKGTLTENDGVFSGFSDSNYLALQQQFQPADKNWEIVIKTEITQLNVVQTIIGSSTNSNNIQLSIRDTNTLRFYRTTNGTTDAVTNSSLKIDSLGVYYFKISFNGSQYKVSVSQDGNNYIDYITTISSTPIYNNSPRLALGLNGRQTSTEYFRGSIDLNNSYIKLGSTKYNLQAVVGYTIVGSPTIVDGVLINPTDKQNTIKITTNYEGIINKFEMMMKVLPTKKNMSLFRFNNSTNSRATIANNTGQFRIYPNYPLSSTNKFETTQTLWNSAVSNNVPLYVRFIYEVINNEYKYCCDFSFNKITWVKNETTLSVPLANTLIEFFSSYQSYATGTTSGCDLYLNETYIKINNKLWFNGQEG